MARKSNNPQSSNKKPPNSYSPPSRNNKIHKDSKKDNPKPNTNLQKPQSTNPTNLNLKFPPPPPAVSNPVQNKSLTEAGKSNLAKLASINKLMTINMESNPKTTKPTQATQISVSKPTVKKPSVQQVSQALQSLKDLQKLLDSYDELEMDQNSNLKSLLEFLDQRKANGEEQKEEKIQQ